MNQIARSVLVLVVAMFAASGALAQSSTAQIQIKWGVADSITADGTVTIEFNSEADDGAYVGSVQSQHELTYSNNNTADRKITIEANNLPADLTLTASAKPTATGIGDGAPLVTVSGSAKPLITGIPGGVNKGVSQVTFSASASAPISKATIVIKYTIVAN